MGILEITKKEKKIMGEVRKRKNSGEAKNGTSAAPAAAPAKSGGLGLIPVVLISALLAGSGCHVIRKDTAKSIADLSDFVGELEAKNVETGQLVEKLRNTVATKDALVESLKAAINKNEKQAEQERADRLKLTESLDKLRQAYRLKRTEFEVDIANLKSRDFVHTSEATRLNDSLNKLEDKLSETDAKIKDEVDVKYQDNLKTVRELGDKISKASKEALAANKKMDGTDLKMEEILLELAKTESASADRAKKITDLEQQLSTSHADAASKLDALNAVIDTLPREIQKDLAKQGGEIESVSSKLAQLEAKVTEQNAQIESNSAAAGDKDELEGVSAKLASLANQVDSARADLVQLSSKMPSQVTMEKMSIQSEKAAEGLETANGLLDKHAKEINALKQAGEKVKQLGNLDAKVTELNDSSTDAAKKVASLEESIKSTKRLVDALDGEVTGLKKRHAESVASANSAQN